MYIKSQLTIIAALACSALSVLATGLSFQTLAPTAGEIRLADGTSFVDGNALFGTLGANLGSGDVGGFSTYEDFSGAFSQIVSAAFNAGGDVAASIGAGTQSPNVNLWMLIDTGVQQGVFYLGATPPAGVLAVSPAAGTVVTFIGTDAGNNLNLAAVPEPSSFALLAGCLGMAWVMVRRRS